MNDNKSLTDAQKSKFCSIILLGCDRSTACNYMGASPAQMQVEMDRDAEFGREVVRAEAEAELRHMGNVHKAAQDEKNWRTSVWWLERRAQERSGADAQTPTADHLAELIEELAKIVVTEVSDVNAQRRMIERLLQAAAGARDGSAEPRGGPPG